MNSMSLLRELRQNAIQKISFSVSNRRKCIANLFTLPMHFRQNFAKINYSKDYEGNLIKERRANFKTT